MSRYTLTCVHGIFLRITRRSRVEISREKLNPPLGTGAARDKAELEFLSAFFSNQIIRQVALPFNELKMECFNDTGTKRIAKHALSRVERESVLRAR